jgi:tetratricopeptide (TPR) repeat protein
MINTTQFKNVHSRMARYYLQKLQSAETLYQYGHEYSDEALSLFDQDWQHIKLWRDWSAAHTSTSDEFAQLCKEFSQVSVDLLILRQHPEQRLEWLCDGLSAARQIGDEYSEMIHQSLLGRAYNSLGLLADAQYYAEQALKLADQRDDRFNMSRILITLGNTFSKKDDYEAARRANELALALSRELDAKPLIGSALNGLGAVAYDQGNFEFARECYNQFLEIVTQLGRPHDICLALYNLAILANAQGQIDQAIEYAQQGHELCRAIKDQRQLASILGLLGDLATSQRKLSEARRHYEESLEIARQINRLSDEISAWGRLGSLNLELGDFSKALQCYASVVTLSEKSGFRWYHMMALMSMAQVFRMMGDLESAHRKLYQGLEIALTVESQRIHLYHLLEAALLWHDRGQLEQAAEWVGILQVNIKELDIDQKAVCDDLRGKLQTTLGQRCFDEAFKRGQLLELKQVMEDILAELVPAL